MKEKKLLNPNLSTNASQPCERDEVQKEAIEKARLYFNMYFKTCHGS